MDYQDFTIDIRTSEGGGFEASVAKAPGMNDPKGSSVQFSHPIEAEAIEALLKAFDVPAEALQKAPQLPVSLPEMGRKLYGAVFQNGVGDLFRQCLTECTDTCGGLRLRLRFDPADVQAKYSGSLPWEALRDPVTNEPLGIDLCTPIVREMTTLHAQGPLEVTPPLRILVVSAEPLRMTLLDLQREVRRMRKALKALTDVGQVELVHMKNPTLEQLREKLRSEEIHVLHFMGHGGYLAPSGNGAIFLVKQDRTGDQVDGEKLAANLKRIPSLRLVVLNACKTARDAGRAEAPFHHGVASAILERTGVSAVIANQHSISDPVAIDFSEILYSRIAQEDGIDEALTEARLRLWGRTSEWVTPVLFLKSADGKLFSMPPQAKRATPARLPTRRQRAEVPVRLGIRTLTGLEGDMESRNDAIFDLTELFDGRYIRRKEDWQEQVFPELRRFLRERVDQSRPLLLDFAAHSSVAFAAGWVLEPKSGLDVTVRQRMYNHPELEWHPEDGTEPEGAPWLDRQDVALVPGAPDVALALSVSHATVAAEAQVFIENVRLPVSRLVDAAIAPEPGQTSVRGGAHALRLAQTLIHRARLRQPHERGGATHVFAAAPNALVFYLGQLGSSLERVVLYEYPYRAKGAYGVYQRSIELPPPGEAQQIPEGFAG